jgi:hypothetical protein
VTHVMAIPALAASSAQWCSNAVSPMMHSYPHATHARPHHADTLTVLVPAGLQEVYSSPEQKDQWDCVAACFFLDTAHNPLQ